MISTTPDSCSGGACINAISNLVSTQTPNLLALTITTLTLTLSLLSLPYDQVLAGKKRITPATGSVSMDMVWSRLSRVT